MSSTEITAAKMICRSIDALAKEIRMLRKEVKKQGLDIDIDIETVPEQEKEC